MTPLLPTPGPSEGLPYHLALNDNDSAPASVIFPDHSSGITVSTARWSRTESAIGASRAMGSSHLRNCVVRECLSSLDSTAWTVPARRPSWQSGIDTQAGSRYRQALSDERPAVSRYMGRPPGLMTPRVLTGLRVRRTVVGLVEHHLADIRARIPQFVGWQWPMELEDAHSGEPVTEHGHERPDPPGRWPYSSGGIF